MQDMQLTTMEALAHACANGDVQQPPDEKKKEELIKGIEGDWTQECAVLDQNGYEVWEVKDACKNKAPDQLNWDTDYQVKSAIPDVPYAMLSKWNRTLFHCRTVTFQAEVTRAEKGEEGKAPKISLAEREDRRDALQKKFEEHFLGVMQGSLRPGASLEDTCYGFAFHNRAIEWPSP